MSKAMFGFVALQGQNPSLIKSKAGVAQLQTRINALWTKPKTDRKILTRK